VTAGPESVQELARRLRTALESADLSSIGALLDAGVHWGAPFDPSPPCQTREEVIAWYRRAKESGARAKVSEILVLGDRIVMGLEVVATPSARQRGGRAARWQVLSVRDGLVVDIVGFDQRSEAVAHAGLAAD